MLIVAEDLGDALKMEIAVWHNGMYETIGSKAVIPDVVAWGYCGKKSGMNGGIDVCVICFDDEIG